MKTAQNVIPAQRNMLLAGWQVKVTVLDDNDPMDEYRYLLSVSTGHRRGAATSSKVNMPSVHRK